MQVLSQVPEVLLYDSVDRVVTMLRLLEYNSTQQCTVLHEACEDYSFPWESSAGRREDDSFLSFFLVSDVQMEKKGSIESQFGVGSTTRRGLKHIIP